MTHEWNVLLFVHVGRTENDVFKVDEGKWYFPLCLCTMREKHHLSHASSILNYKILSNFGWQEQLKFDVIFTTTITCNDQRSNMHSKWHFF